MLTTTKLQWQKDLRGADLTATEYMVLLTLSTYASKDGTSIHPGWTRLIKDTHLDIRTAKKAVTSLIKKGFLAQTEVGGNQYGYKQANVYELLQPPPRGTPSVPLREEGRGTSGAVEGVHPVQARGTSSVDEGVHPVSPHQGNSPG